MTSVAPEETLFLTFVSGDSSETLAGWEIASGRYSVPFTSRVSGDTTSRSRSPMLMPTIRRQNPLWIHIEQLSVPANRNTTAQTFLFSRGELLRAEVTGEREKQKRE